MDDVIAVASLCVAFPDEGAVDGLVNARGTVQLTRHAPAVHRLASMQLMKFF
jgi:hypothetical protein